MSGLPHGYTNHTRRAGSGIVEKRYVGAEATDRFEREYACLSHLAGRLPIPLVIGSDASIPAVTLRDVAGTHGQDAVDAGNASEVLGLLGSLLDRLQKIETAAVPGLPGSGPVIVHGDFGPQNVLIQGGEVRALLDWEFAHLGHPVEDLAWAEWIIRMHHPGDRAAIPELLVAAQLDASWTDRQAAMVARCVELLERVKRSGSTDAVNLWRQRLQLTESWTE